MARIVRSRRTRINKQRHLPEATESANAVGEILVGVHGQQPWILQVMEAVQAAVDNGVKQLGNVAVQSNSSPHDPYRFRARSKEELEQSMQEAANHSRVDPRAKFAQLNDPAGKLGTPPEAISANGLSLPEPTEAPDERAVERPNGDPMSWLL